MDASNLLQRHPIVKAGRPADYAVNTVSERWVKDYGFVIVRFMDGIVALSVKCTHQACKARYLATENDFKCPQHGATFRGLDLPNLTGINVSGPAPRPLERFQIGLDEDGEIVVDTGTVYRQELTDNTKNWSAPGSFLAVH